jgi:hypothetical protein
MKPFHTNTTREERQEWFAHTPPWDRVPSSVVDAILDGITDKVMLDAFVLTSMEQNLVPRYEPLGRQSTVPDIIRAQVSHILCLTGNQAIVLLAKALETNDTDAAGKAYPLAMNTFKPAIALAKNQVVAYAGISTAYGMIGKRSESHEYAKRGLAELAEMRRLAPNVDLNRVFPPRGPRPNGAAFAKSDSLVKLWGHSGGNAQASGTLNCSERLLGATLQCDGSEGIMRNDNGVGCLEMPNKASP